MPKKSPFNKQIEAFRHKNKRVNIPTQELRDFVADDEATPKSMLYPRDPSLDPRLVWKGKDEQDRQDLAVPVVPVYIQEKIQPLAVINGLPRVEQAADDQPSLFADFNGGPPDFAQKIDFYHHEQNWSNRLILVPALPFCHRQFRLPKPKQTKYPIALNSLGDHIRKRRLDLKLLQKQVAEQIGVSEATVTNWERNATAPVVRHIPAIIRFLGYNPIAAAESFPERLRALRRALGLSQRKMAEKFGVDPATVRDWERGRHRPAKKSTRLLDQATRRTRTICNFIDIEPVVNVSLQVVKA